MKRKYINESQLKEVIGKLVVEELQEAYAPKQAGLGRSIKNFADSWGRAFKAMKGTGNAKNAKGGQQQSPQAQLIGKMQNFSKLMNDLQHNGVLHGCDDEISKISATLRQSYNQLSSQMKQAQNAQNKQQQQQQQQQSQSNNTNNGSNNNTNGGNQQGATQQSQPSPINTPTNNSGMATPSPIPELPQVELSQPETPQAAAQPMAFNGGNAEQAATPQTPPAFTSRQNMGGSRTPQTPQPSQPQQTMQGQSKPYSWGKMTPSSYETTSSPNVEYSTSPTPNSVGGSYTASSSWGQQPTASRQQATQMEIPFDKPTPSPKATGLGRAKDFDLDGVEENIARRRINGLVREAMQNIMR